MYLLGREVIIEWKILFTDNPSDLADFSLVFVDPDRTKTYELSPDSFLSYTPPTATTVGSLKQSFKPKKAGMWNICLAKGEDTSHQIISTVEMFVFDRTKEVKINIPKELKEIYRIVAPSSLSAIQQNDAVNLSWVDNSTGEEGFIIYRSQSLMDTQNLPAPLTTIPFENSKNFVDPNVEINQSYYYGIATYGRNQFALDEETFNTPVNLVSNSEWFAVLKGLGFRFSTGMYDLASAGKNNFLCRRFNEVSISLNGGKYWNKLNTDFSFHDAELETVDIAGNNGTYLLLLRTFLFYGSELPKVAKTSDNFETISYSVVSGSELKEPERIFAGKPNVWLILGYNNYPRTLFIYLSVDNGDTFEEVPFTVDGIPSSRIGISKPYNLSHIGEDTWIVTEGPDSSYYITNDNGKTWFEKTTVNGYASSTLRFDLVIGNKNGKGLMFVNSEKVLRTEDNGVTWSFAGFLPKNNFLLYHFGSTNKNNFTVTGDEVIVMDKQNNEFIKTYDFGSNWEVIPYSDLKLESDYNDEVSIGSDGSDAKVAVHTSGAASVFGENTPEPKTGLLESIHTWEQRETHLGLNISTEPGYFNEIKNFASGPDGIIVATGRYANLTVSKDYGKNWQNITFNEYIECLESDNKGTFVAGTERGDIYVSRDNAVTWFTITRQTLGLTGSPICQAITTNRDGTWIISYANGNLISTDNLITFSSMTFSGPDIVLTGTITHTDYISKAVYNNPISNTWIALGRNGKVLRSLDGGTTWESVLGGSLCTGLACNGQNTFIVTRPDGAAIRTVDAGETWIARPLYLNNNYEESINPQYVGNPVTSPAIYYPRYIATDGTIWISLSYWGPASYSLNDGEDWMPMPRNFGAAPYETLFPYLWHSLFCSQDKVWLAGTRYGEVFAAFSGVNDTDGGNTPVYLDPVVIEYIFGNAGDFLNYTVDVPEGTSKLRVSIEGANGDADLYVKALEPPTLNVYDASSVTPGSNESLIIVNPAANTYHIMLHVYESAENITLTAEFLTE